jgi:DNA-directed RNA polymerase specialized sigma24 family protein
MCRPTFDALDRSWAAFTRSSEAAAALCRWREDQHLDASDLEALVQRTWQASKPQADRTCAALARRAGTDAVAARTLLQILRPGLRNLGRRLALGGSFEDVDQELLALAWERIRTYPIDRRPATIAGNILLDVRKHYVRAVLDPDARSIPLAELPPNQWPAAPSAEHEAVDAHLPSLRRAHAYLAAAVDRGTITATSAAVVWRTRIEQDSDDEVADELGVGPRTLQRRRQRAERQLARAS